MNATIEIDKAGRIVVPKKLRDALHLAPGTRLKIERHGDTLVLTPNSTEAHLVIENGVPLIFPAEGTNAPVLNNETVNALLLEARLERERRFLCLDDDLTEVAE
jgi:AbrB family looped-hinge helix DNA binding protein